MNCLEDFLKRKKKLRSSYITLLLGVYKSGQDNNLVDLYLEYSLKIIAEKLETVTEIEENELYSLCYNVVSKSVTDENKSHKFYDYIDKYARIKPIIYDDLNTVSCLYYQDLFDEFFKWKYKNTDLKQEKKVAFSIEHEMLDLLEENITFMLLENKDLFSEFKEKLLSLLAVDEGSEINNIKLGLVTAMIYRDKDSNNITYFLR